MSAEKQQEQFSDTPSGWAARIKRELEASRKALAGWHKDADESIAAYLDERSDGATGETRWNIYTSDTQTQEAMLYGKTPSVTVTRRFADAKDDLARVAGVIQERVLNQDIERDDDTFTQAVGYALNDKQLTDFGQIRVRYTMGETVQRPGQPAILGPDGMERAPAVPPVTLRPNEQAETDYVHWQDFLWGPCRVWHEVPWVAFRAQMSRRELAKKFGEDVAEQVPIGGKEKSGEKKEGKAADPWDRADVWEVWVKEEKQVFFFVDGYPTVLAPVGLPVEENGGIKDPLGLRSFFPCPRPMISNATTKKLVPRPDYRLARDLHLEINDLSTRIRSLEQAIRVVGLYDKTNTGLKRLLSEAKGNEMIPVENWAMHTEKGGLRGVVDWFPLEQVVNALTVLRDYRSEQVDALRQITGMSDIMRGQADVAGTSATEQNIKAKFGSVRMQRRQDELARFCSDAQRLRAEVMAKHFESSTYLARCNCENTPDAPLAPQAVEFLKSELAQYRIEVKPEAISLTDFAQLKQERTEVITAIAQYMTAVAPIAQQMPGAAPALLEILQWMVSGLRGASQIEGVLDRAIAMAQQVAAQPQKAPPPDPKLLAIQAKGQMDLAKVDKELQADVVRTQMDAQAEDSKQRSQMMWNLEEQKRSQLIKATMPQPTPGAKPGGMR